MARLCLFCSKKVLKRSREHIVPQWLWDYVGLTKTSMIRSAHKGRIGSSRSQPVVLKDLHDKPMSGFVEGRVCTECNTGWMSRLEVGVKPLLLPILDSPTLLDEWPAESRKLLARWTVKTSLMAISTSVVSANAPVDHFTAIKRGIISHGISVFLGHHFLTDKGFSYEAGRHWILQTPREALGLPRDEMLVTVNQHSYKVCLQFRSLLLMAAFSPMPELVLLSDERTHQLVWTGRPIMQRTNLPMFTNPRRPMGMMLTSDKARRHFADLMHMAWLPGA
jgi:hypothetical protein